MIDTGTNKVSDAVIDTAQEKVLTSIRVQDGPQGIYTPQGIVVSTDGARVCVVYSDYDDQLSTVSTVEAATNVANRFADSLAEIEILNPANADELKVISDVLTVQPLRIRFRLFCHCR